MTFPRFLRSRRFALAAFAVALFFAYSFLPLAAPPGFVSPDENANEFFTESFAETDRLWSFVAVNFVAENLVHPRSTRVVDGYMVPGGFIGLPVVYGFFAKAVGMGGIPFVAAALAVAAVFAFGRVVAAVAGKFTGDVAVVLLALHPAWWFWSARPYMPNAPFLWFLLFAAFFFFIAPIRAWVERQGAERVRFLHVADSVIAGVMLASALAIRPSEAPWLAFAAVAALVFGRRRVKVRDVLALAVSTAAFLVPFVFLHKATYGSFWTLGYVAGAPASDLGGRALRALGPFSALFPLGFSPKIALAHAWSFGVILFPLWSALVAAALVWLFAVKKWKPNPAVAAPFVGASAVAALWLVMFYGSFQANDRSDGVASIAGSLVRYWLPLFLLSVVPVAVAAAKFFDGVREFLRRRVVIAAFVAYAVACSLAVFAVGDENLLATKHRLEEQRDTAAAIFAKTEPDSIIIVDTADKYLFPRRRVIQPLRSEYTYSVIGRLAARTPTYYFGITLPEQDVAYLKSRYLDPQGVDIMPVLTIGEQTLYRFASVASSREVPAAGETK